MSLLHRLRRSPSPGLIAFNMRPVSHPWGGGNQWLDQLGSRLRSSGYDVRHDLRRRPCTVVLVDPRVGGTVGFGADEIAALKERDPAVRCLHRVNECDVRKATNEIDDLLARANPVADHTVFISGWLRDYHAERWFDLSRPHSVILNGADASVFHPDESTELEPGGTIRLVTHHWSANPLQGFDVYQEVDRLIA